MGAVAVTAPFGMALCVVLYGLVVWSPGAAVGGGVELGYLASVVNAGAFAASAVAARVLDVGRLRFWGGCLALALTCLGATLLMAPVVPAAVALCACAVAIAAVFLWWLEGLVSCAERVGRMSLVVAAGVAGIVSLAVASMPEAMARGCAVALLATEAALLATAVRDVGCSCEGRGHKGDDGVAASGHEGAREGVPGFASPFLAGVAGSLRPGVADEGPRTRGFAAVARAIPRTPRPWPSLRPLAALTPVLVASAVLVLAAPLVNGVLMVDALPVGSRRVVSSVVQLGVALLLAVLWLASRHRVSAHALLLGFTCVLFLAFIAAWATGLALPGLLLALGSAGFFLALYACADACLDAARGGGLAAHVTFGMAGSLIMGMRVAADVASLRLLHAGMDDEVKTLVAMFLMVYLLTCAAFGLYHALSSRRLRAGAQVERGASDSARAREGGDPLALRCDRVGEAFGLSRREREVLGLLMRGRNVPAIADELSLSRNTVQTHVRHLYEHLGVHGRQELIALVEQEGEMKAS